MKKLKNAKEQMLLPYLVSNYMTPILTNENIATNVSIIAKNLLTTILFCIWSSDEDIVLALNLGIVIAFGSIGFNLSPPFFMMYLI